MPWLHVGFFVLGAYAGNLYEKKESKLLEEVNQMRAETGLPPFIGSQKLLPGVNTEIKK